MNEMQMKVVDQNSVIVRSGVRGQRRTIPSFLRDLKE